MPAMGIVDNYRQRDRMMRVMSKDGKFRASVVKATDLANNASKRHRLNPLASVILGELLMGALLSASHLKEDEQISIRLEVNGEIKSATAEANMMGEVRGYLGNPDPLALSQDPAEMKKLAIGIGLMHVTRSGRVHMSMPSQTQSTVMLEHSNVPKDLTHYFAVSEQIPTAIRLEVKFNEDFTIRHALGFMVQAMPGLDTQSDEDVIIEIENNIIDLAYPSELIDSGEHIEDIMNKLLKGEEYVELSKTPVDFFCRCSKEKFLSSLALLGVDELSTLDRDQEELRCHHCSKTYIITHEEIQKEIDKLIQDK